MNHRVHYSPEALNDLDSIWDYIIIEFCDIETASGIIGEITSTIERLEDYPELGAELSAFVNMQSNYRFLTVKNHKVFYRIECGEVYIDRILHDKRDFMNVLF